ncbi:MAG TPA: hypothetical protein VK563_06860 [Puia sp.]|nr:hypothetical protein [Puia sp.]
MSRRIIISILFLLPALAWAQTDLLILKNNRSNVFTYTTGAELQMKTVYDQWLQGTISDLRHDSIYINGAAFHYHEIAAIRIMHNNFSNSVLAAGMLVAGGGIFVLGAVNGLYRGDKSKDWYTGSGLVTGGALLVVGFLLTKTRYKTYRLGNKYRLEYLTLNPNKK